jgi:nucleotide-binding universal stress UspA family protein
MRDLYFFIFRVDDGKLHCEQHAPHVVSPQRTSLIDHLNIMRRGAYAMNAIDEATKAGAEPVTISTAGKVTTLEPGDVLFFSWSCELLSPDLPGCAVPKPGVVLAARRGDSYTGAWPPTGIELPTLAGSLRLAAGPKPDAPLSHFLSGPAASADPITRFGLQVFISYSSKDRDLAAEMKGLIEAPGVSVFLAEMSIPPGELWSDRIRAALRESDAALLLLTPDSVERPWVMAEVGALWALDKPFVPAVMYAPDELPEFITRRQCIDIRTTASRKPCAEAVVALCPKKI